MYVPNCSQCKEQLIGCQIHFYVIKLTTLKPYLRHVLYAERRMQFELPKSQFDSFVIYVSDEKLKSFRSRTHYNSGC